MFLLPACNGDYVLSLLLSQQVVSVQNFRRKNRHFPKAFQQFQAWLETEGALVKVQRLKLLVFFLRLHPVSHLSSPLLLRRASDLFALPYQELKEGWPWDYLPLFPRLTIIYGKVNCPLHNKCSVYEMMKTNPDIVLPCFLVAGMLVFQPRHLAAEPLMSWMLQWV